MAEDAKAAKPEKQEIASSGDGRDITKPYVSLLQINQDSVLAARGGGLEVYEEVLRDDQVFSCFQQRRLAVASREWQVDAGAEDKQSQMAADFMREMLFSPQMQFDDKTDKMHYGRFYGYAIAEMMWGQDGRNIVIDQIKVRRARRFRYDPDGGLRLLTRENMAQGELMPPQKFWTWSVGADNDDAPYGLGLGHQCYWPVWFKRNGIKFWLIALEKYGMPTAVGTYPPNTSSADQDKLLAACRAIATDSALIKAEGMLVELLQSQGSRSPDYAALYDHLNDALSKIVLSQTRTTDASAGSLGNQKEQMEVRDEVAKADSDLLCGSFNRSVVKWLCDWNYPDAVPPRAYRNFDEEEDLDTAADRDTKIYAMGFEPSLEYITEKYGGQWMKRAPAPPPSPFGMPGAAKPNGDGTPAFAESDAAAAAAKSPAVRSRAALLASEIASKGDDAIAKEAHKQAQDSSAAMQPLVDQIIAAAAASKTADEFRAHLRAIDPDITPLADKLALLTFQSVAGALLGETP